VVVLIQYASFVSFSPDNISDDTAVSFIILYLAISGLE
jgi:hypothetical protein